MIRDDTEALGNLDFASRCLADHARVRTAVSPRLDLADIQVARMADEDIARPMVPSPLRTLSSRTPIRTAAHSAQHLRHTRRFGVARLHISVACFTPRGVISLAALHAYGPGSKVSCPRVALKFVGPLAAAALLATSKPVSGPSTDSMAWTKQQQGMIRSL